jgi:hypothetical protein
LGVPVDATTGSVTIAAADIRSAVGLANANLDTQLSSLSSGQTTINNNVNSRLAASSYTAPPSAATNASAVRTELSTELGRIDATVSSRSTYAGGDTSGTTTLLSRLTSTRAENLDNLDAAVSSRSTYAGGDTSGTTTLLGRLTSGRAGNLDNLDATMSSRLASSGYTAPPSASSIATAVWANATRTLTAVAYTTSDIATAVWAAATRTVTGGTVDTASNVPSASTVAAAVWNAATRTLTTAIDNSSTIAAAVWTYASGRTITGGTVDTLTNAPSAAQIASQVRTELNTELGRIDVATSTRLASNSYTTPPTAATITATVWAAADKTGYSLTEAERTAIATAVQAGILNENDGQAILNAIVNAIGNQNIDQVALVAAIRADLERSGGTLATRLAASAYTTPPTGAQNASAVRSELATELGRIDATISSRLAPDGTLATVTNLINAPDVPTPEEIAAEVWSTTTKEVTGGTIDTLVNAPSVPTPEEIAGATRTELAPELARLANASTTQEVADIVEGAMAMPES